MTDSLSVSDLVAALIRSEGVQGAAALLAKAAIKSTDANDRQLGYTLQDTIEECYEEN